MHVKGFTLKSNNTSKASYKDVDTNSLVSIIMPIYNSESFIINSVESVLDQTYKNWELILIDDCSIDSSYLLVQEFALKDPRIKLYRLDHNHGAALARNYATEKAQGKYIAFLDSDDLWLPSKLEKQITFMEKENILLSYSSYYTIGETNEITGIFHAKTRVSYKDMLKTSTIGTLTTVYNADKLGKYYFDDIGHEDYVMKLQILKTIDYAKGIDEPLAKYRITSNGLSGNKFKTARWQWKIYRDVEHLSFLKSLYYFMHYIYFGLRKYN